MKNKLLIGIVCVVLVSCGKQQKLPFLGPKVVNEQGDSIFFKIPPFEAVDQDGKVVNNSSLAGTIYVAEFFFTSCPTICPIMTGQLMRVQEKFKDEKRLKIVSFTLDPEYDTPEYMKEHAKLLGINTDQWWFLHAPRTHTYKLAQTGYFVTALEDKNEVGGIVHSGKVSLIDGNGHIRAYYDGTVEADVNLLINDIAILLVE